MRIGSVRSVSVVFLRYGMRMMARVMMVLQGEAVAS
jgi:hypothetical protein